MYIRGQKSTFYTFEKFQPLQGIRTWIYWLLLAILTETTEPSRHYTVSPTYKYNLKIVKRVNERDKRMVGVNDVNLAHATNIFLLTKERANNDKKKPNNKGMDILMSI